MSLIRRHVLEGVQRVLLAVLLVIGLAVAYLGFQVAWKLRNPAASVSQTESPATRLAKLQTPPPTMPIPTAIPLMTSLPPATQTAVAGKVPIKIGIVAGHWQNDSGAVCEDGLMEVEINLAVAQRVVSQLTLSGYYAEMLAEFSSQLDGYKADALVSIHTDSCSVPDLSGFKVARVSSSLVPEIEDQLVSCLIAEYQEATKLQFHRDTITFDMTEYHAFYEIAPETPGTIIEIGFMAADRSLLTRKQDVVAKGIVNGIKCFVESVYKRGG